MGTELSIQEVMTQLNRPHTLGYVRKRQIATTTFDKMKHAIDRERTMLACCIQIILAERKSLQEAVFRRIFRNLIKLLKIMSTLFL